LHLLSRGTAWIERIYITLANTFTPLQWVEGLALGTPQSAAGHAEALASEEVPVVSVIARSGLSRASGWLLLVAPGVVEKAEIHFSIAS